MKLSLRRFIDEEVYRVLIEEADPFGSTEPPPPASSTSTTTSGNSSQNSKQPPPSGTLPVGEEGISSSEGEELSPEEEVMKLATELSKTTRDIPTILMGIKSIIQKRYQSPEQALGLVNSLINTKDETLKAVAVRLNKFLGTTR